MKTSTSSRTVATKTSRWSKPKLTKLGTLRDIAGPGGGSVQGSSRGGAVAS